MIVLSHRLGQKLSINFGAQFLTTQQYGAAPAVGASPGSGESCDRTRRNDQDMADQENLGVMSLLSLLWLHAVRAKLVHPSAGDEEITLLSKKLRPSLALYVILIIVGLFVPLVAVFGYLVLAFLLIVPIKLLRRQRAESVVGQGG